jgi:hypothetical protein
MHGAKPATYDLGGVPIRVLFAPDHTTELEIVKQILKGSQEWLVLAIDTEHFAGRHLGRHGERRHPTKSRRG